MPTTVARTVVVAAAFVAVVAAVSAFVSSLPSATEAVSSWVRHSVFLQTLLSTMVVAPVLSTAQVVVQAAWGTACKLVLTSTSTCDQTIITALRWYLSTHASTVLPETLTARLEEDAKKSWSERLRTLVTSLRTRKPVRNVLLTPSNEAVSTPLCVDGTWVLVSAPILDIAGQMAPGSPYPRITLTTYGYKRQAALAAVLTHVMRAYDADQACKEGSKAVVYTAAFEANTWKWKYVLDLAPRSAETLALQGNLFQQLLDDATKFFSSVEQYQAREQPFRRGWLLSGPPGTGKSSTAAAIASALHMPICVLQLSHPDMTDASLQELMSTAYTPSIILIEDVDVACPAALDRKGNTTGARDVFGQPIAASQKKQQNKVTLCGLLNATDGVVSHQGHLTIYTSNDVDKLDPALVRKGRCDVHVELAKASSDQLEKLFLLRFPDADEQTVTAFTDTVMDDEYSPATITTFLHKYTSAADAVRDANLEFNPRPVTGYSTNARQQTLYERMWSDGCECLFAEALLLMSFRNIRSYMADGSMVCILTNSTAIKSGSVTGPYVLRTLPDGVGMSTRIPLTYQKALSTIANNYGTWPPTDNMRRFAHAVVHFNKSTAAAGAGHTVTVKRLLHFLSMHSDDFDGAVAMADQWLFNFHRPPEANVRFKFTLWHALHAAGYERPRVRLLMKDLLAAGIQSLQTLVRTTTVKFEELRMAVTFLDGDTGMTHVAEIGYTLEDAFGCTRAEAFAAARTLCGADGRCWFLSAINLRTIVSESNSTDALACVAQLSAFIENMQTTTDESVFAELREELAVEQAQSPPGESISSGVITDAVANAIADAVAVAEKRSK